MKKIIAGYEYDTAVANIVKKNTYSYYGDPKGYEQTLYAMPDGKLFFYTNGGSESLYKFENIKRVSRKAAEAWLSENN